MQKIKVGIEGYGKMGKNREESFKQSGDVSLIAVFDSESKSVNEDIQFCSSYEELLKTDIDAIFIAAYVNVSASYVMRALEAEKHVFCEKPPAVNFQELLPIKEYQKNSDLILKYGFNHRMHHSVREAKDIIDNGSMLVGVF